MNTPDLETLLKKYPEIFKGESFHFQCENGWFDILDCLLGLITRSISRYQEVEQIKQDVLSRGQTPLPWIDEYFEKNKINPLPTFKVVQIKEKFGGLRFYFECADFDERSEITGAVSLAERLSFRTCESCGHPGETKTTGNWMSTLCATHRQVAEAKVNRVD